MRNNIKDKVVKYRPYSMLENCSKQMMLDFLENVGDDDFEKIVTLAVVFNREHTKILMHHGYPVLIKSENKDDILDEIFKKTGIHAEFLHQEIAAINTIAVNSIRMEISYVFEQVEYDEDNLAPGSEWMSFHQLRVKHRSDSNKSYYYDRLIEEFA